MLGGDHSIGYPTARAVAEHLDGNLGIIHFDRHVDTQETDLDERMHTTPSSHATDIPNVPPKNLVQIGIGGWQAPARVSKSGASGARRSSRSTTVSTWDSTRRSRSHSRSPGTTPTRSGSPLTSTALDAAFVPGTGWPEPGGFLPREALKLVTGVARRGLAGIEIVECSPPYDNADITALLGVRVICDVLGTLVNAGHLPKARQ